MDCSIRDERNQRRLIMTGRFSYADAARFGEILRAWDFQTTPSAILDANGLLMIDSVAIGMLFLLARQCRAHGGGLSIVNGRANIDHTLQRSGLLEMLRGGYDPRAD